MIDMSTDSHLTSTNTPNNTTNVAPIKASLSETCSSSPITTTIGAGNGGAAVSMLLARLDEGTQTIINLRSILTLKTAELNELLAQLELTNQAITTVESTTTQIESMLKEFGLSADNAKESLLMNAEASLDSAIKTATSIYPQQFNSKNVGFIRRPSSASTNTSEGNNNTGAILEGTNEKRLSTVRTFTSRIRYKPDSKHILRKLNDLLRDLELDSGKFFASIGTTDDFEVLQKAFVDLDIAKTISLSAKSNLKRRNIWLRSTRRRNKLDEIQILGDKIREGVDLWDNYTRGAVLMVNGEDIITILDREDMLLSKNLPVPSSRITYDGRVNTGTGVVMTPSTSSQTNRSTHTRQSSVSAIVPQSTNSNDSSSISNTDISNAVHSTGTVAATAGSTRKSVYNRKPASIMVPSADSFLPSLSASTVAALSTIPTQPMSPTTKRARQVKANVGLSRVRTTSFVQQQQQKNSAAAAAASRGGGTTTPPTAVITTTNTINRLSISSRQSYIPAPPSYTSQNNVTASVLSEDSAETSLNSNSATASGEKKSMLKPPSQRGPGSTLRLRSMLAKRGSNGSSTVAPNTNGKPTMP